MRAFDRKLTLGILLCLSTVDLVTNISRFYIGQKCSINLVNYHVIFVGLGSLVEWLILRLAHAFADVLGQIGRVFGPWVQPLAASVHDDIAGLELPALIPLTASVALSSNGSFIGRIRWDHLVIIILSPIQVQTTIDNSIIFII